jgi:hypothetical protein
MDKIDDNLVVLEWDFWMVQVCFGDLGNSAGWQTVLKEKIERIDNIGVAVSNFVSIGEVFYRVWR